MKKLSKNSNLKEDMALYHQNIKMVTYKEECLRKI
jgi:hypothetical protein